MDERLGSVTVPEKWKADSSDPAIIGKSDSRGVLVYATHSEMDVWFPVFDNHDALDAPFSDVDVEGNTTTTEL